MTLRADLGLAACDLPLIAVQDKGVRYILRSDGRGYRRTDPSNVPITCKGTWGEVAEPWITVPVKGGTRPMRHDELQDAFGVKIDDFRLDHTIEVPKIVNDVLHAPPPRLPLPEPVEHPEVAEWLAALFASDHDRVLDWLAWSSVDKLGSMLPALAIVGPKSIGKTVIAHAIAASHGHTGAMPIHALLGDFNDGADTCSVFLADEKTDHDSRGIPRTREIRELVTARERWVNPKGFPRFAVTGFARMVFAVNRFDALFPNVGQLTANDADAIAERFLCVDVSQADGDRARTIVNAIGAGDMPTRLRILAEHIRWLQTTRTADQAPGRMAVATDIEWFAARLVREIPHLDSVLDSLEIAGQVVRHDGDLVVAPQLIANAANDPRCSAKVAATIIGEHLGRRDARGEIVTARVRNLWHQARTNVIVLDPARLRLIAGAEVAAEIEANASAA